MLKVFLINSLLPRSTYRNSAMSMSWTHSLIAHRVPIKHITINECDLFFHYHDVKEISFYHFHYTKHETSEFHLYCWDHVFKVNENCLVEFFHQKFRVSTQIMILNDCIKKCEKFSVCIELLMAVRAICDSKELY